MLYTYIGLRTPAKIAARLREAGADEAPPLVV